MAEKQRDFSVPEKSGRLRRGLARALRAANAGRLWFRAFRRTRPFWGGLWSILGGAWIVNAMSFSFVLATTGGWNFSAGYILGGTMVLFGLVAWFAPIYKSLTGIMVVLISLAAFVSANLGGYLVGTVLGIIGGSMMWAWGEKKPKASHRSRGKSDEVEPESSGDVRTDDAETAGGTDGSP